MIQNLNKISFAAFGTVFSDRSENHGFPTGNGWTQVTQTLTAERANVYCADGPVFLDFEEGMTVLVVTQGDKTRCFYLDKPVCIPAGVSFAAVPYLQQCSIRVCFRDDGAPMVIAPFVQPTDFKISRKLTVGNVYTVFYQEKEKGFIFKGEKHQVLELTYVDKGQLHSVADGADYLLQQGDMMIYSADQWHMQYADEQSAPCFVTVSFDMEAGDLTPLFNRRFTMSAAEAELLKKMMAEAEAENEYSGSMILCLLEQLLLQLLRSACGMAQQRLRTPAALRAENEMIEHALQYVAEHICERLSVGVVAREVGVSASHLTALFHKNLQIAPGEYIRRSKLEESKLMIKDGNMNFTQIAQALNYSTVHHFSRQFKEKYGITPSEYARAIK